MEKQIYADFDAEGIYIYQAFKPKIVKTAVTLGKFGKGFGLDRITWIKPSFAWMLRRSNYATKHRMESIARIKITHEAWLHILGQSVETHFNSNLHETENEWQTALNQSDVIHQWDPERALNGERLRRQAIQIGIRGAVIRKYAQNYIIDIQEVTSFAKEIGESIKAKKTIAHPFPEKNYPLPHNLFHRLGCQFSSSQTL